MSQKCVEDFATKCKSFFDECNGGQPISIVQLKATLKQVNPNFNMDDAQLADIFSEIDKDSSSTISWEEFSSALLKKNPKEVTRAELESLFKEKDKDGSGKLNKAEIKQMLDDMGVKGNAEKILNDSDKNNDGEIDFNEFLAAWASE